MGINPNGKKVDINQERKLEVDGIMCYDLTYGYLVDVENGVASETKLNVVMNGTDLSEDEVRSLRVHQVNKLNSTIMYLTYPEVFNEDGTEKAISVDETDQDNDKKKV